jgi:hypothetical protein
MSIVATFVSTHAALRAEKVARAAGLVVRMVPVPRHLSTDCHMGLQTAAAHRETLTGLLRIHRIEAVIHDQAKTPAPRRGRCD